MAKNASTGTQELKVEGGCLVVRLPLGAGVRSSTGKSLVVASTGGFTAIPDSDVRVNITAIRKG